MAEPAFSAAITAHGTLLQVGSGASPYTYTTIAEVIDITGPGLTGKALDASNQSSGNFQEFIAGMVDGGKISFDVNYIPTDPTQDYSTGLLGLVVSGARTPFKVIFPNSGNTTWTFSGIVLGFAPTMGVDAILRTKIDIQLTGTPVLV